MTVHRTLLITLLIIYTLLATTYSLISPLFEVSDELWHYPMVKVIADTGQLPIQDPANPGLWRQEGSQPPLYYMLGAALTFWIDTSDLLDVRRVNPHADIGVIRPDGNANMMVHRPELESFPWRGTTLAVHLIRFMSVAMGLGTVYITYQLGYALFPDQPVIGLTAAALVAFLPMFLFIHGSVNNDALSNLLGNLITLLLVRLLLRDTPPNLRDYIVIGITMGAGLLSKGSIAFLIFVVALVLLILSLRYRDWKPFVIGGLVSGGLTNLIAAWWYIRNWRLYGDPTGLNMFLDTVGRRLIPANAAQLWAERNSFLQAYWGFFGGVNLPLPDWAYLTFNWLGGLALLSGLIYLMAALIMRQQSRRWWWAVSITLIWMVITFVSYTRWTAITPASQGRLVFGALSGISLWMAVGLVWITARWKRYSLAAGAVGFFAAISIMTPFALIHPAYTPPLISTPDTATIETVFTHPEGGSVALLGAAARQLPVQPSEYVHLTTNWEIQQPFNRDWSLFIHLTTPDGVIIAQRDVYPGRGLLATSDLIAGTTWQNPIAVNVPAGAYAPMTLDVLVGWYHLQTGERLINSSGSERTRIGQVQLIPRTANHDHPNPIRVNFDNRIELIGYEYSTLTPRQGEEVSVTLYWRALEPIPEDFVIFVHIIDAPTFTIVGGSDAQPVGWTRPTSTWDVGEVITDTHTFTVREDALSIPYELEIGMYTVEPDGTFPRLRVVTPDGGMADNYFYLSRVRVLPAESASNE